MTIQEQLLKIMLAEPQKWFSGTQLATELQVSRAAIWKAIQAIQKAGYTIDSRHGAGYRMVPNNRLSAPAIEAALPAHFPLAIQVYDQVTSTNVLAKQLAAEAPIRATAIIANQQTAGYGRYGRQFYSPGKSGLYLSILLPVTETVDAGLLTTGTAVAVAESLTELFDVSVELKWVNDVLVNHHKAVGILTEAITDLETGRISAVIVGIGINLTTTQQQFPTEIQQKAGAVTNSMAGVTRNQVAATVLNKFMQVYANYQQAGFMPMYRRLSVVLDQTVEIQQGPHKIIGRVQSIDDHGALKILTTQGVERTVTTGEITKLNIKDGDYHG